MTCKDCSHYQVCQVLGMKVDEKDSINKELACVCFKEKQHGEWRVVYQNEVATVYECSRCGHLEFGTHDYCICGAKMDGDDI